MVFICRNHSENQPEGTDDQSQHECQQTECNIGYTHFYIYVCMNTHTLMTVQWRFQGDNPTHTFTRTRASVKLELEKQLPPQSVWPSGLKGQNWTKQDCWREAERFFLGRRKWFSCHCRWPPFVTFGVLTGVQQSSYTPLSQTHVHARTHTPTHAHTCTHTPAEGRFRCCWGRQHQAGLYLETEDKIVKRLVLVCWVCWWRACRGHSPSSSSRLAPPPVLTWLTLSSVFHLAQQVAVSPPPGQNRHDYSFNWNSFISNVTTI